MGHSDVSLPDRKRRRSDLENGGICSCSNQDWGGVIPGKSAGPRL